MIRMLPCLDMSLSLILSSFFWICVSSFCSDWMFISSLCCCLSSKGLPSTRLFLVFHPLPIYNWYPSSWIPELSGLYMIYDVHTLKRNFLKIRQFHLQTGETVSPTHTGFLNQKLWMFIFVALEPWAVQSGLGLGLFTSKVSLWSFIHHTWMWHCPLHCCSLSMPCCVSVPHHLSPQLHPSYPSGWMWLL